VWVALGAVLGAVYDLAWIGRAVILVVSPLWFMAVYLMLVALLPLFLWLHARFDTVVLVFMVGVAGAVDIARFRYDLEWLGLVNMVVVWGLCHQLGFFYHRLVSASRRTDWTLLFEGCSASLGWSGPVSTRGPWWASRESARTWRRRRCASPRSCCSRRVLSRCCGRGWSVGWSVRDGSRSRR
jgi:hypothetical protein